MTVLKTVLLIFVSLVFSNEVWADRFIDCDPEYQKCGGADWIGGLIILGLLILWFLSNPIRALRVSLSAIVTFGTPLFFAFLGTQFFVEAFGKGSHAIIGLLIGGYCGYKIISTQKFHELVDWIAGNNPSENAGLNESSDKSSKHVSSGNDKKLHTMNAKNDALTASRHFKVLERVVPKGDNQVTANELSRQAQSDNKINEDVRTVKSLNDLENEIKSITSFGWKVNFDGIRWEFQKDHFNLYAYTRADVRKFSKSLMLDQQDIRCPTCGSNVLHGGYCHRC